jgi:hypothetical protein
MGLHIILPSSVCAECSNICQLLATRKMFEHTILNPVECIAFDTGYKTLFEHKIMGAGYLVQGSCCVNCHIYGHPKFLSGFILVFICSQLQLSSVAFLPFHHHPQCCTIPHSRFQHRVDCMVHFRLMALRYVMSSFMSGENIMVCCQTLPDRL